MTPYEQAKAVYQREPCYRTFEEDMEMHLRHGYVFSTPLVFAMARVVGKDWDELAIIDPGVNAWAGGKDCWHVHCMAGDMGEALAVLPFHLPYVSFQRRRADGVWLRVYKLDSLRRLVTRTKA